MGVWPGALGDEDTGTDSRGVDSGVSDGPLGDRSNQDLSWSELGRPDGVAPDRADPATDLPRPEAGQDLRKTDLPGAGQDLRKTDLPKADVSKADLSTPKPDLAKPDQCAPPALWWNARYHYRLPLTISKSGTALAAGYSVAAVLNTQSLITGGQLLASGDDLRVMRAGATPVELDRRLVGLGTTQTQVWFKTQDVVNATDTTYVLYFGNASAGSPPAAWVDAMGSTSKVYLAADDFEGDTVGALPTGWVGSASYKVELDGSTKVVSVNGTSPDANYLFAGDFAWTDVVVEAQLRVLTTSGQHYGLWTHAVSATSFDTLWFGLASNSSLQCYTSNIASPTAQALTSSTLRGSWSLSPAAGTTWHAVEVRHLGQTASFLFDGKATGSYTLGAGLMTHGRIGLCAGYATSHAHWDNVVVRRYVSPEPTVAVGSTQSGCP